MFSLNFHSVVCTGTVFFSFLFGEWSFLLYMSGSTALKHSLCVLAGEKDIPGLTDSTVPRRLGPKRASKIRKLFNLSKEDDVRQYVVRRPLTKEGECDLDAGFSKSCLPVCDVHVTG